MPIVENGTFSADLTTALNPPGHAEIIRRGEGERELRRWLCSPADTGASGPAVAALTRPGAIVEIAGGRHITITPLAEIAALLAIDIVVSPPAERPDPLHPQAVMAEVRCTVTRPDGVSAAENGVASSAELTARGKQRWTDWHALASMASTRAKVRALTTMLMPVLQFAARQHASDTGGGVVPTPAEIMPIELMDDATLAQLDSDHEPF